MHEAMLGGVPGHGLVRSRPSGHLRDYAGTFSFDLQHETAVWQIFDTRDVVEFSGVVDGRPAKIKVFISHFSPSSGEVMLQGSGGPY